MKRDREKTRGKERRKGKRAAAALAPEAAGSPDMARDAAFEGVAFRLSTAAEAVDRFFARGLLLQFRLSIAEWRVLSALASGKPIDTADVIARTQMDRVRVSRAVLKLSESGLVTRIAHPKDHRAQKLALSEAGRAKYPAMKTYAEATNATLNAALSLKQLRRLEKILPKLVAVSRTRGEEG